MKYLTLVFFITFLTLYVVSAVLKLYPTAGICLICCFCAVYVEAKETVPNVIKEEDVTKILYGGVK